MAVGCSLTYMCAANMIGFYDNNYDIRLVYPLRVIVNETSGYLLISNKISFVLQPWSCLSFVPFVFIDQQVNEGDIQIWHV